MMATPAQAMRTKFASNVGSNIIKPGIGVAGEEGVKGMLDGDSGNGNAGFAPPGMQSISVPFEALPSIMPMDVSIANQMRCRLLCVRVRISPASAHVSS